MPADFSSPVLSTAYASFLSIMKERDVDALTMCLSDPSNIPTGAMKWDRGNLKLQEYSGSAWTDRLLSISGGGTGANTAGGARTNLGLGTLAVQDNNAVSITGGTISGVAAPASIITSGLINVARLGSGAAGAGLKVLYDDNTWKDAEAVGTGKLWFTNTPPSGYLICDGSAISTTTYAALYALLGTLFNTGGEGAGNFRLPDLRQRFPLGKAASGTGSTIATSGGAIDHTHTGPSHTHTYTDVIAHSHGITDPGHRHGYYDGPGGGSTHAFLSPDFVMGFSDAGYNTGTTVFESKTTGISVNSSGVATGTTAASGTGATGTANPPYLVVNFIIKY